MNRQRGIICALLSVLLGSAAQLGMRWSMTRLPVPAQMLTEQVDSIAVMVVAVAIFAYALSVLAWLGALRDLPLGRAYSLLSISYALVYVLAAALPLFNEEFSTGKSLGVALVILGVLTINSRA